MFLRLKNYILKNIDGLTVIIIAGSLRFINLGYSDFQGDEIKALFLIEPGQSLSDFLLSQRKGPVQFIITYFVKILDPSYSNYFLDRFIFALFGFLAAVVFYKLVKSLFNSNIAVFAALFFSTNGFLIALSRIIQYQSAVILFMLLALYSFTHAITKESRSRIYIILGFVFWAISILSHYDGVFIFPFAACLLYLWWTKGREGYLFGPANKTKTIILGLVLLVGVLSIFYIPFIKNIDAATISYWNGRVQGTGGKISSSIVLFRVYQPIYAIHIYASLFILGLSSTLLYWGKAGVGYFKRNFFKNKQSLSIKKALLEIVSNRDLLVTLSLIAWFGAAFLFMEGAIELPGTHIYTYIIPATILAAIGMHNVLNASKYLYSVIFKLPTLRNIFDVAAILVVTVLFSFLYAQSYIIYVDNSVEYPWQQKKFFIWNLHQPSAQFHLSLFGFPYSRDWKGIKEFVYNPSVPPCPTPRNAPDKKPLCPDTKIKVYSGNERTSISRYSISYQKDYNIAGYFIYIKNPQTFFDTKRQDKEKPGYWMNHYPPVKEIVVNGKIVAEIYYMPPFSKEELIEYGY